MGHEEKYSYLVKSNTRVRETHHIFIKKNNVLYIWVISLIKCLTSILSSNVRLSTHTFNSTIPSLSVSLFIILLKQKLFHSYSLVLLLTLLPRHMHFNVTRCLTTAMLEILSIQGVSFLLEALTLIPLIGHEEELPY